MIDKTKVNYRLDPELVRKARIKAINTGLTMTKVITKLLQEYVK